MENEYHPVVKLLLTRMESHPEEFAADLSSSVGGSRTDRWWQAIRLILESGTEEEKSAINQGTRKLKLQRAHEMVMDELCNGEERRRKEQEEHEYERQMMQQAAGSYGKPLAARRHHTHADMEQNGIMNTLRNLVK